MMNRLPLWIALSAMLCAAGCGPGPDDQPIDVSVIGHGIGLVDPSAGPMEAPQRLLIGATAQGLVRFDAHGQIEPALAERWIVIDGGRSYIFRIGEAEWPDGSPVTAGDVVAVLDRARAPNGRNPLRVSLANVQEVEAMTPQIVELRLRRAMPQLLNLLAAPELAMVQQRGLSGSGPMRVVETKSGEVLLRPAFDPRRSADEDIAAPRPADDVRIHADRASVAIARYQMGKARLVEGGSYLDWPLLQFSQVAPANIRFDGANGLFGLAVLSREGFFAAAENREALAMAIDREALTRAFLPEWGSIETVLPDQADMARPPTQPQWVDIDIDERRETATTRVAAWRAAHAGPVTVRIALPDGLGARLVWINLRSSLRMIGLNPVQVGMGDDADLRLIDAVAPLDAARWYLTTACQQCSVDTVTLIEAVRDAPDVASHAARLSEADAAITAETAYIPIARPLRWSLVSLRLGQWQRNARAWHPLNRLRNESN